MTWWSPESAERVVVLTRQGCHLCDEAIAQVAAICAETGEGYAVVDVDSDPELQRRYTDQVPVTFVDGAQHDFGASILHGSRLPCCGLAEPDAVHRRHPAWSRRRPCDVHVPTLGVVRPRVGSRFTTAGVVEVTSIHNSS